MRFLLGVLVGYSMRGNKNLLITVLVTAAFIVYIILPAVALLALSLDVRRERQSRPAQTRVPSLKGLSYENAETKLHASNLNIQLLATRSDLPLQPGLIIDQVPQPGEEVVYGYSVGVTITKADSHGPWSVMARLLPLQSPATRVRNGLASVKTKLRPWGYESHPVQIGKVNLINRLQPQRFFKGFICFYIEQFAVGMILSEFPSQYRHKVGTNGGSVS